MFIEEWRCSKADDIFYTGDRRRRREEWKWRVERSLREWNRKHALLVTRGRREEYTEHKSNAKVTGENWKESERRQNLNQIVAE